MLCDLHHITLHCIVHVGRRSFTLDCVLVLLCCAGAQDGSVKVWDMRALGSPDKTLATLRTHTGACVGEGGVLGPCFAFAE